jgi:hypothetical protein
MRGPALALLAGALAGCAHRVTVTSAPAGAYVFLGDEPVGTAPLDLAVPLVGPRVVRAELPGYRPFEVRLGFVPRRALELRLVREHGAAGTWEPEEAR